MSAPSIALACPGVGRVQRGFERLFRDLQDTISTRRPTVLYKGGGPRSASEKVPFFLPRGGRFLRILPIHKLVGRTAMHAEGATFGLSLMKDLKAGKVDLLHTIDPPLTRFLFNLRRKFNLPFHLLYTEGTAMPPGDYPPADFIHQMSLQTLEEAREFGYRADRMRLLPLGIHSERFQTSLAKDELRRMHGIPRDAFVICCVAALNRYHKRTDYVIDEISKLGDRVFLWLDGSLDHGDPDLPDYAHRVLGDRVKISRLDSDKVGHIYGAADLKVLGSSFEAFGLVIPEAMATGTPILVHDTPHFEWLVPHQACRIDMTRQGALAERIAELIADPDELKKLSHAAEAHSRFDWENLRDDYLDLYDHVLSLPPLTDESQRHE